MLSHTQELTVLEAMGVAAPREVRRKAEKGDRELRVQTLGGCR